MTTVGEAIIKYDKLLKTEFRVIQLKMPVQMITYMEDGKLHQQVVSVKIVPLQMKDILKNNPGRWILQYSDGVESDTNRVVVLDADKDYILDTKYMELEYRRYKQDIINKYINNL